MLNLTHKAIARMARYRVKEEYRQAGDWRLSHKLISQYKWYDIDIGEESCVSCWYYAEQEAWEACCIENKLIEENNDE